MSLLEITVLVGGLIGLGWLGCGMDSFGYFVGAGRTVYGV